MTPALRAAVLQEWRGLPQHRLPHDRWQTCATLVPALMKKLGLNERLRENDISSAWATIVGEFIAANSHPAALRDGVLYVRVIQPALHYELEQIVRTEVLRKLRHRFGKTIRDVRFRIG